MDERPVLTQSEVLILRSLRRECRRRSAPTTIPQLSAVVEMSPAHVGHLLRRLMQRGLVLHPTERGGFLPADMVEQIRAKQMGETVTA